MNIEAEVFGEGKLDNGTGNFWTFINFVDDFHHFTLGDRGANLNELCFNSDFRHRVDFLVDVDFTGWVRFIVLVKCKDYCYFGLYFQAICISLDEVQNFFANLFAIQDSAKGGI